MGIGFWALSDVSHAWALGKGPGNNPPSTTNRGDARTPVVVTVLPPLKPIKEINRRFTLGFKLLGFWLASRKIGRLGS